MNDITIETIAEEIKKSFWYLNVNIDLKQDGIGTIDFFRRKSDSYELRFAITKWEKENMMVVEIKWGKFYVPWKRLFLRKVLSYIESLCSSHSFKLLYIASDDQKTNKITTRYLPSSYQNIETLSYDYLWRQYTPTSSGEYFIKNITPNFSELFVHTNQEFITFFETLSNDYPTFSYSFPLSKYYGGPFYKSSSLSNISFYIDGWRENCSFSFKENGYSFTTDSFGTFSSPTTEEIKDHIRSLIEKIQTKQRVKTLFEEPKMYYQPFIERYFQDEEIQERIYHILRSKYKPNEIEAMVRHAHIRDFVHFCDVTYFTLNGEYFVLQDKQIYIFSSAEKEQAITQFKSVAFQQMTKTFEQSWNVQKNYLTH